MARNRADFTNTFVSLTHAVGSNDPPFRDPEFRGWHDDWHARLTREIEPVESIRQLMRRSNPRVIPRNHRVEQALAAAANQADLSAIHRLIEILARPYDYNHENTIPPEYTEPAPSDAPPYQTFCGT